MIRLHLTAEDLLHTRVVPSFGPLAETMFALARPAGDGGHPILDRWRARLRPRPGEWTPVVRALVHAGTPGHPPVDLFTLTGPSARMGESIEDLADVAPARVAGEIEGAAAQWYAEGRRPPPGLSALVRAAGDDRAPGRSLGAALSRGFEEILRPYWHRADLHLAARHRERAAIVAERGIEALLGVLHPAIRWEPPVLTLPSLGTRDLDLRPGGRGLLLAPSLFATVPLVYCPDPERPDPYLVFVPAAPDLVSAAWIWRAPSEGTVPASLAALLGPTRAAVLAAVRDGGTTTELSGRVGVSPSTASEHASVLRAAGLIRSERRGGSVWHTLTPLGTAMLDGAQPAPGAPACKPSAVAETVAGPLSATRARS